MKTTIEIPEGEYHVVRVFSIELPDEDIAAFNRRNGTWPLRDALGVDVLNAEAMALFPVSDLAGVSLSEYLEDGQGIPAKDIDPIRESLDHLKGYVLVLPSSALSNEAHTLKINHPLKLIATLSEDNPPVVYQSLPELSAKSELGPAGFDGFSRISAKWFFIVSAVGLTIAIVLFTLLYL